MQKTPGTTKKLTDYDWAYSVFRAQRDPVGWIEDVLGDTLWGKQKEIAESVRDNPRTAVPSCHGAGKSYIAARIALWFSQAFPNSIVATTAPTFRQVEKIIWQEFRSAFNRSRVPLVGRLLTTELKLGDKWFAFGFSTDDPDAFQGLHADHVLVILDEAAGVDPAIWTAAEGVLSSEHCRLLSIGNPTESSGAFYEECRTPGTKVIHISAYDTPNLQAGKTIIPGLVTEEWVKDKERRWKNTPMFQARVLGEFPDVSTDALIPLSWIEKAAARDLTGTDDHKNGPVELGCDIARFGDDETVIASRRGPVMQFYSVTHKEELTQSTGRIIQAKDSLGATAIKIDEIGVGAGVADMLKEQGHPVTAVNVAREANEKERFLNLRAELYWNLRERFETGDIDIPEDDDLKAELSALKYKFNSRGKIQIETKEEMKKRLDGESPDRADATMLCFAPASVEPEIEMW